MPKACPYVMMQFFTLTPIVIDLNYYIKEQKNLEKGKQIFIFAITN